MTHPTDANKEPAQKAGSTVCQHGGDPFTCVVCNTPAAERAEGEDLSAERNPDSQGWAPVEEVHALRTRLAEAEAENKRLAQQLASARAEAFQEVIRKFVGDPPRSTEEAIAWLERATKLINLSVASPAPSAPGENGGERG